MLQKEEKSPPSNVKDSRPKSLPKKTIT